MEVFLVFYGYLSIAFGWLFYGVVFISFGFALYTYLKKRNVYSMAEVYIRSFLYLGSANLLVSSLYSLVMTAKYLL